MSQVDTMHSLVEETLEEFNGQLDPYTPDNEEEVTFTAIVPTSRLFEAQMAIEDIHGVDRVEIDYTVDQKDTAIIVYLEV